MSTTLQLSSRKKINSQTTPIPRTISRITESSIRIREATRTWRRCRQMVMSSRQIQTPSKIRALQVSIQVRIKPRSVHLHLNSTNRWEIRIKVRLHNWILRMSHSIQTQTSFQTVNPSKEQRTRLQTVVTHLAQVTTTNSSLRHRFRMRCLWVRAHNWRMTQTFTHTIKIPSPHNSCQVEVPTSNNKILNLSLNSRISILPPLVWEWPQMAPECRRVSHNGKAAPMSSLKPCERTLLSNKHALDGLYKLHFEWALLLDVCFPGSHVTLSFEFLMSLPTNYVNPINDDGEQP